MALPPHPASESPALFPIFLKLAGRACLVVGAGTVAQPKIEALLACGAHVTVVAPEASESLRKMAAGGQVNWFARGFTASDLDGVFLAITATSNHDVNKQVSELARRHKILVNSVDDPPNCDFYTGAVVRRGSLQIAISTDGKSPSLAQRLRQELERQFGPEYSDWLDKLGEARRRLFETDVAADERRRVLHAAASRENYEEFVRQSGNGDDQR
jgi:precorrin-2 dehydrogenase